MAEWPAVDRRRREDIREYVESVAPYYTDEWDPAAEDASSALVALFAEMAADVTERLDRTPEKHRIAFFDALGFDRRPPLAATLPVTFTIADGAEENVAIESGTEVVAAATDDRPETTFRIGPDDGFEATPARLREIYSVEPEADQLFDHRAAIDGGSESTLFAGTDCQENALYVGHPDLFEVSSQSKITVTLETSVPESFVRNGFVWEYYGEQTVDGEVVEGWHEMQGPPTWADYWPPEELIEVIESLLDPTGSADREKLTARVKRWFRAATVQSAGPGGGFGPPVADPGVADSIEDALGVDLEETLRKSISFPEIDLTPAPSGESAVTVELAPKGPFVETAVNGVESKWIRCRVPDDRTPTGPYDLEFAGVSLDVAPASGKSGGASSSLAPDLLLANDVPQKNGVDGESITPFGEMPQQRDAFYVASQEAFTKKGATVTLQFDSASSAKAGSGGSPDAQEPIAEKPVPDEAVKTGKDEAVATVAKAAEVAKTVEGANSGEIAKLAGKIGNTEIATIAELAENAEFKQLAGLADEVNLEAIAQMAEADIQKLTQGVDISELEGNWSGDTDDMSTDGGMNVHSSSGGGTGGSGTGGSGTGTTGGQKTGLPQLSWEYWNGDGWLALDDLVDETSRLQKDGSVTFAVPDDIAATTVAGHEGVWIRARLVSGEYGEVVYKHVEGKEGEHWEQVVTGTLPRYDSIEVSYEYPEGRDPAHLFAYNNREFGPDLLDRARFHPFEMLADHDQTVYFGFDGPLRDGPIQVFADLTDHEYPEGFNPRVRWEYCTDPERDEWVPLDGTDASEGFTEQGIASLAFPEETTAFSRFGHERHWIRARVRGDAFGPARPGRAGPPGAAANVERGLLEDVLDRLAEDERPEVRRLADLDISDLQDLLDALSNGPQDDDLACGEVIVTEPPAGKPTNERPTLRGVYPNAGMAANVTVVEEEVVGSSDGSPRQSFVVSRPPVVAAEVWVDELSALSAGEREDLLAERPDAVDERTGPDGETQQFWVRWESVTEFFESGTDDRHYTLDSVVGEITFGDGTAGRIPPHGRDNVRVTYRTGGGPEGNVAPGAVGELKSAIPLVDAVTNPAAGAGGASSESTEAVLERAPRALRDRGRAVTAADFERIAMDASRQLARVRCLPEMDRSGEHAPGWVTLLVVPNDQRRKPTPSVGLKQQVERAVGERAPARLVARDRIEVRGPSYVAVRAEATIVAGEVGSLGELEDRIDDRLAAFFHPLTGREDGEGWAFGDLPAISDVFALLEGIDGVDYVADLQLHFQGSGEEVTVTEGEAKPSVAPDALVHSGVHDLTVGFVDRTRQEGS